jgi:hypothetical protein
MLRGCQLLRVVTLSRMERQDEARGFFNDIRAAICAVSP